MLRTLLFTLFLLSLSLTGFSKNIDIREAVKAGFIKMTVEGNGGHSGKSIRLKLTNLKKKKLSIYVPSGLIFASVDSSQQDLIIIQERILVLDKLQKRSFTLYAMCIQSDNSSPTKGSLFEVGDEAETKLMELVKHIDENNIRTSAAQYALWAVSDDKRVENIVESELAIFTANLLGKPIPVYFIRHARQNRPGQSAFVDAPVVIEGTFKYKSDETRVVSFGLYNNDGDLLYSAFDNQEQKKGHHKFKFLFEVRNVAKGKYYARLMSEDVVLEELAVEF